MIVTVQDLQDRKIQFNIDMFLKSRLTPKIYFKYFYREPPKEYPFVQVRLPKINRNFV